MAAYIAFPQSTLVQMNVCGRVVAASFIDEQCTPLHVISVKSMLEIILFTCSVKGQFQ